MAVCAILGCTQWQTELHRPYVVKLYLEPLWEPLFHPDSYGYRPGKSAKDAIFVTRKRCWKYDWVVEFDIKGAFDNIDRTLLMKAVHKHCPQKWLIMYIE